MLIEYSIRDYVREDFPQFLACVKDFYEDGYPYKEFLDADSIEEKLASGDFLLTVAVTPQNEVIGVFGAQRHHAPFEGAICLMLRNVRKEYRGHGIASAQLNDLLQKISVRFSSPPPFSLYANVMTHDTISQNSLVHRGYTLCGLRLMVYKNSVMVPALSFPPHTKMTQAVFCRKCADKTVTLAAPAEYREDIYALYQRLGIPCTFRDCTGTLPERSDCQITESDDYANAEIFVNSAGQDLDTRLRDYVSSRASLEDYTFVAYLDMTDNGFDYAYQCMKSLGFYFSGIMPLTHFHEYMILAKTDGCQENFSQIALEDPSGFWQPRLNALEATRRHTPTNREKKET